MPSVSALPCTMGASLGPSVACRRGISATNRLSAPALTSEELIYELLRVSDLESWLERQCASHRKRVLITQACVEHHQPRRRSLYPSKIHERVHELLPTNVKLIVTLRSSFAMGLSPIYGSDTAHCPRFSGDLVRYVGEFECVGAGVRCINVAIAALARVCSVAKCAESTSCGFTS
jgi:hypothetical protein